MTKFAQVAFIISAYVLFGAWLQDNAAIESPIAWATFGGAFGIALDFIAGGE